MIRAQFDALYGGRPWINQAPSFPLVLAAPQSVRLRVNHLPVERIVNEELDDSAQIKHSPRLAGIMRDIGTGHVAANQYGVGIVGADRWMEHCPATPRA